MTDSLPQPDAYRSTQQIGELNSKLQMTVEQILGYIGTAQNRHAALKQEIANRWKNMNGVSPADRQRLAQNETASAARDIIKVASVQLDASLKSANALYNEIRGTRPFYPTKLQFLMNSTLSSDDRVRYTAMLVAAGPHELAGYAALAIGRGDTNLAAATAQANDALPNKERRFSTTEIVSRIKIAAWDSLQAAYTQTETRFQQAIIAVRTFKAARPSPVDAVRLAMMEGKVGLAEDGSIKE